MYTAAPRSLPLARSFPTPATRPVAVEAPLPRDTLRVALMVILLLSVGRMQEGLSFLMPLRLGLVCTGVSLLCVIIGKDARAAGGPFRSWPAKVILGLVIVAAVGAPFGLSLGESATTILDQFSKIVMFALLLIIGIRGTRDLRWFVWGFVAATAYLCFLGIFVAEVKTYHGSAVARLDGNALGAYDANDMGVILTMAIPFALLTMQTSRRLGRAVSLLVLMGIGMTIAITGSRGAFLGVIAVGGALLVYLSYISLARRIGAVALVAGMLVIAAPPGYWTQMHTIIDPEADYNRTAEDGRLAVWKRGAGYMMSYPVFGVGIGNFGRAEGTISDKARNHVDGTGLVYTAAHNSFVQVGAELGILGLALWSTLVFGGLATMHRLRRRLPRSWLHGDADQRFLYLMTMYLPVAFIGFIVTGMFVSFAYMPPVFILAAFVAGMHASVERRVAAEQAWAGAGQGYIPAPARRFPGPRWAAAYRQA